MTSWVSHLSSTTSFFSFSFRGQSGKCSPPKYALIHRIFAWGAHQDREDRRAHHVSFGPRPHPSSSPFSSSSSSLWLVFILLAGAEWPFMLAAVGYGCLCLCVCERESEGHDIPSSDVCQAIHTHIHSPCPTPVWILCHTSLVEPQSCHFSSHRHHSTKSDRSAHKHTALSLSLGDIRLSHALVQQVAAAVPAERGMSAGVRGETCAWQIYDRNLPDFTVQKQQLTSEEN